MDPINLDYICNYHKDFFVALPESGAVIRNRILKQKCNFSTLGFKVKIPLGAFIYNCEQSKLSGWFNGQDFH